MNAVILVGVYGFVFYVSSRYGLAATAFTISFDPSLANGVLLPILKPNFCHFYELLFRPIAFRSSVA